jgi:hypothetical protein
MAENGEHWPDDLIYALPYPMQERLQTLRTEVKARLDKGQSLAPGQFFRLANELEFREREFLRGGIHQRVDMVVEQLDGQGKMSPAGPAVSTLAYGPGVDWHRPSGRQFRQVNLSSLLHNHEQATRWTGLLLGRD